MSSLLSRLRRPEYTGENRCTPCTLVNLAIAVGLSVAVGAAFPPAGAAVLVASLSAIYLRGYLVPGTPTLTKRYLPERVLAWFDKAEHPAAAGAVGAAGAASAASAAGAAEAAGTAGTAGAAAETGGFDAAGSGDGDGDEDQPAPGESPVNPETLLVDAGVVEECVDENDLCLADGFAAAWDDAVARLRDDPDAREAAAADLFDRERVRIETDARDRPVARAADADTEAWKLTVWPSEGAMVADLAAASALADRVGDWTGVNPSQRAAIAKALRSFLPACPLCGGSVAMTEETVDSCCRSFDVVAVRCTDCEEHFLELDPAGLREVEATADGDTGASA